MLLLAHQKTKYNFEIIICEDGSIDNVPSLISLFSKNYPDLQISYLWQQDRGFRAGQARNMGIRQARGEIIILLDGDMLPAENFINRHVDFHQKHKRSVLSTGRKIIDDKYIFPRFSKNYSSNPELLWEFLKNKASNNMIENNFRTKWYRSERPWMAFFSCSASFPNDQKARYNEHLVGWGIEDWDIAIEFYSNNYDVIYQSTPCAYHVDYKPVISNAFRNNNHSQLVDFARNTLLFIDTHENVDLTECAIALRNYALQENNTWTWAGDDQQQRDYKESIEILRQWLHDEGIYSKSKKYLKKEPNFDITLIIPASYSMSYIRKTVASLQIQIPTYTFKVILLTNSYQVSKIRDCQKLFNNLASPYMIAKCEDYQLHEKHIVINDHILLKSNYISSYVNK